MDVHRCRFVPYPPSAINATAFSHTSSLASTSKGFPTLRLAVGRANGDIEIWNPLKGVWLQESILRGGKDRSIEGLVWTQDPDDLDKNGWKTPGKLRLFSIGYSTSVTEWDLALGRPLRHSSGNYGEIWCIAAQPITKIIGEASSSGQELVKSELDSQEQDVVAGCADGAIVLMSTRDGDLRFSRTLARPSKKKARVLCATYQNRNIVITGHADSTIRVFDTRNSQQIRNISLGAGPVEGPKETLVWSVKCLHDGTLVSGDSTGTIRFWDGKNFTLMQRIKSHLADILDVAASADGETVISGGMDRRTTLYRRIGNGKKGAKRQWAELTHRRLHKHDVKTMATFETKNFSVLVSGGLDTSLIIMPIQKFGKEFHRTLSGLPQQTCIGGASSERLMMSWWSSEIRIWWIPSYDQSNHSASQEDAYDEVLTRKLAARVAIQGEESLVSVDLMSNGRMLSACSMSNVKLFHLRRKGSNTLKVSKTGMPLNAGDIGAKIVKFSPDGKWLLIIRTDSSVQIFRLREDDGSKSQLLIKSPIALQRLSRDPAKTKLQYGSLGDYERSISRVAFSADSRILVVGDLSGYLDTWVLEGYEDLTQGDEEEAEALGPSADSDEDADDESQPRIIFGQHWIRNPAASLLPKLSVAPIILSFRPLRLGSTAATNGNRAVHPTRRTPHPHSHDLPDGEDRLFVFTSEHQMYEFHIMSGKLSDWSRRNPTSSLPQKFRDIRDRAMGVVWDVWRPKERIWLYGSSWLWMFDLSDDLQPDIEFINQVRDENLAIDSPSTPGAKKSKRKRGLEDLTIGKVRKFNTGAGGNIPEWELGIGIGQKFRKIDGPEASDSQWISADLEQDQASDDDDAADLTTLISLRRGSGGNSPVTNVFSGDTATIDESSGEPQRGHGGIYGTQPYWGTHRYRDILGIVPLGNGLWKCDDGVEQGPEDDQSPRGVEVTLIERPIEEVDLPPRYYGDQEWGD